MTPLPARAYLDQRREWPAAGRHILAHFDGEIIVVYQAYRPAIAAYALQNGRFGGDFSYSRMSWIKPNFLWMMYRSGWGTKEGQETILALRLRRPFFRDFCAPPCRRASKRPASRIVPVGPTQLKPPASACNGTRIMHPMVQPCRAGLSNLASGARRLRHSANGSCWR